ncbi:hypothetical protein CH330_01615 [candidate division WOR-3 bacterium JGI_Cruoil_03_51_56]|uniref:Secretion system C-terminal sorting domain-containing protein n=1 Tax=candidate division WOR-3 bacterium JGI_Cruoil_03_51_56 TaxID=1973747 RepID=A0A235BXJ0_UNCW3|nr:MAG: hypothetical protein CH330_01615 [candidate division WOR-3 bacterium JGI_Cruoil_03_51_56]
MEFILCLMVLLPNETGMTTPFKKAACSREELANETRSEWLNFQKVTNPNPAVPDRFSWVQVDSLFITGEFAPGKRIVISHALAAESLELYFPPDTLPLVCQQALNYAPAWTKEELRSAFRRLGDSAEFYARLLLDTPQKYADEVAFCIANIGPEALVNPLFNPELLLDNARYLYELSDSLQYAEIIDCGSPPGDYFSTVRYKVLSGTDTIEKDLPKDIYYNYLVHPTTSDELPRMDGYVYNSHWREYLFFCADSGYPILGDYMKKAKVVWTRRKQVLHAGRPFDSTDCALDIIGNWASRTVPVMAAGNRPIHPSVIAHEHNGNCGELQDLLTAACRTCLIPAVNTMDPCEDHVWSEFYEQGWYPYQVDRGFGSTHIADTSIAYDEQVGGSKRVSAIWNWRPDGFWWTVTGMYSNTCSLYVRVLDQVGLPMDGARVLLYSEGISGGLSTTAIGFTDNSGAVAFELGDLRNFYARISTPIGNYPSPDTSVKIIDMSQTGSVYFKTFYIPSPIPAARPRLKHFTGDSLILHKFEMSLITGSELDYGYCISRGAGSGDPDDSVRFYQFYADMHPEATIDLFITDTTGYNRYLSRERFGALWLGDNIPARELTFVCPTPDKYYLIFSSEDKLYTSRWIALALRLYHRPPVIAERNPGSRKGVNIICPTISRHRLKFSLENLSEPLSFRLYDVSGRLLQNLTINQPEFDYESELPSGVYLLKLKNQEGEVSNPPVRKLIVLQ